MSGQQAPTVEDITEIAEEIWASYLDPDGLHPLMSAEPGVVPVGEVSASVSISGSWHGHVVLKCSAPTARHAAGALLAMEVAEVASADIVDAMGELANIVGGNLKSTLPAQCSISLPHVVFGSDAVSAWPSAEPVCELVATWLDEPISISVWQSRPDSGIHHGHGRGEVRESRK
jgi:chemotaxis protein CheX